MMKKHWMSLLLSGALMASMATPAFAIVKPTSSGSGSSSGSNSGSNTVSSTTGALDQKTNLDYQIVMNMPTVDVTVSSNNAVVLNPYKLSYTPAEGKDAVSDTVVTAVNTIVSNTKAPVDVDVTITSEAKGSAAFAKDFNTIKTATDRQVAMGFCLWGVDTVAAAEAMTADDWGTPIATQTGSFSAKTSSMTRADAIKAAASDAKAQDIILEGGEQALGEDSYYYVMAPAEDNKPTCAAFKLIGQCTTTSGTDAWTAADTVTVSAAFTFTVLPNEVES